MAYSSIPTQPTVTIASGESRLARSASQIDMSIASRTLTRDGGLRASVTTIARDRLRIAQRAMIEGDGGGPGAFDRRACVQRGEECIAVPGRDRSRAREHRRDIRDRVRR